MNKSKKTFEVFKYVVLLGILAPVLYISRYARPVLDDFDYGLFIQPAIKNGINVFGIIKGAWEACCHMYETWQGTYASCFIMPLHPGMISEKLYGLTTWLLVGMLFGSFWLLFYVVKKQFFENNELKPVYWALLSTVVLALGMPYPVEGLYWYVGAMHYIPWVATTTINMAIMIELYYSDSKKKSAWLLIASCMISFITSGGNQCTAFENILLVALVTIIFVVKKKSWAVVSSLLVSIIGFVIMWIAPGNGVRQSHFNPPGVIGTLVAGVKYGVKYSLEWSNLILLAIIVLFLPFIILIARKIKNSILCRYPLITILSSIMVFCGMLCVPYYGTGQMGPYRLINIIWVYYVIAIIFDACCILGSLEKRYGILEIYDKIEKGQKWYVKGAAFLICAGMIFCFSSSNVEMDSTAYEAVKEIKNHEAQAYADEFDARLQVYMDDSVKEVVLEPLSVHPKLLFMEDLTEDVNYWTNVSVAKFYDKDSVRVEK